MAILWFIMASGYIFGSLFTTIVRCASLPGVNFIFQANICEIVIGDVINIWLEI